MHRNTGLWGRASASALGAVVLSVMVVSLASAQRPSEIVAACESCHPGIVAGHQPALDHAAGVTCLTCHHVGFSDDATEVESRRLDACAQCHADLTPAHEEAGVAVAECTDCHTIHADPSRDVAALVEEGSCQACHGVPHTLHAGVGADAPGCTTCHTVHADSLSGMRLAAGDACATCHGGVHPSHEAVEVDGDLACTACHGVDADPAVAEVDAQLSEACASCHEAVQATHEQAGGLLCTDCHDFADDPQLSELGPAMSRRCGGCHYDVLTDLESGGHAGGVSVDDYNPDLPNCMTCHTVHADPEAQLADVRLQATLACIECHSRELLIERYQLPENVAASYVDDYHGATVEFLSNHPAGEGQPSVMVCSDCHGAHAVGWQPETALSGVCLECHQGDDKIASAWLGHGRPGPGNQAIVWAIRLFYYVLIPFVLAGLFLNILLHLRYERRRGARMLETPKIARLRAWLSGRRPPKPATVPRFNRLERAEHMAAMVTFTLLVVTGLPQTAPRSGLANAIIAFFGGIGSTRFVHRIAGFLFVALLLMHVTRGVRGAIRRHKLPEIVPRRKDFENVVQMVRHFLVGAPKPRIGKFDAAAKFEYWGLFLGGTLMSVTGLVLVFPELVSQFAPGIVVAAMRVMHGLEATFAVLVVLLWHSWSVIFRPDIFPLDTSMFTGEIEVDRLKEEHTLEYERIVAEGELDTESA